MLETSKGNLSFSRPIMAFIKYLIYTMLSFIWENKPDKLGVDVQS
jgi:hypothetical protein